MSRRGVPCQLIRRAITNAPLAHAEALVIDVFGHARVLAADDALLILSKAELPESHLERVVLKQSPDEGLTLSEDDLDRLGRLDHADHAREDTEDAGLRAARGEMRRGRLGIEAAIAGPLLGPEGCDLPIEAEDRAVDDGDILPNARIVHEIARREVVEPVHDHIPALIKDPIDVFAGESLDEGNDLGVG